MRLWCFIQRDFRVHKDNPAEHWRRLSTLSASSLWLVTVSFALIEQFGCFLYPASVMGVRIKLKTADCDAFSKRSRSLSILVNALQLLLSQNIDRFHYYHIVVSVSGFTRCSSKHACCSQILPPRISRCLPLSFSDTLQHLSINSRFLYASSITDLFSTAEGWA